jgi:uncharacterized protein VirK/YbjX
MNKYSVPKNRFDAFKLAWNLTQEAYFDRNLYTKYEKFLGRALAAFIKFPYFTVWVKFLLLPENYPFAQSNPLLWQRPLRGYLSSQWNDLKKIKVLMDSYRFAGTESKEVFKQSLLLQPSILANCLLGSQSCQLKVLLDSDQRFRREGEWVLKLYFDNRHLYSCSFSVEEKVESWVAYIGAIQGGSDANRENLKIATKLMYGLNPKKILVVVMQELARSTGIKQLLGAGNSIQMASGKTLIYFFWRQIPFNYDNFWEELKVIKNLEGWFEIPSKFERRSIASFPSQKWSWYRRRYEFLDQIEEQMKYYGVHEK